MTMMTQITWAGNTITYTTSDELLLEPANSEAFGANIIDNKYENGIGTITFDGEVTSIGTSAFIWHTSLTSIEIPESVTSIEEGAFYYCTNLASLVIPSNVTSIGSQAFQTCLSLSSIVIPSSVSTIGNYAFTDCQTLSSIEIPSSVISIGERAFAGCTFMRKNFINNSNCTDPQNWGASLVDEITSEGLYITDNVVIRYVGNATSVTIPEGVIGIADHVFSNYYSLISVEIPSSVTSIGNDAFSGCSSLSSILIPERVTSIGGGAFANCTSLTSIEIPSSVNSIGENAFYDCVFFRENFINKSNCTDSNNWGATIVDQITSNGLYIRDNVVIKYEGDDTSVTIPEGVIGIADNVFAWSNLTSIEMSESVTSIGNAAFYGCFSLTSIVIPGGTIGNYAFADCPSLSSIEISKGVTEIAEKAFDDCVLLKENFKNYSDCTDPNNWGATIADQITPEGLIIDNNVVIKYRGTSSSVIIPKGITGIADKVFSGFSLTSVVIPASVTSIGDYAFQNCNYLKNIYVGENPPTISGYTFSGVYRYNCKLNVPAGCANVYQNSYWRGFSIEEENLDLDHDGCVDVSDITRMINYLMKQLNQE